MNHLDLKKTRDIYNSGGNITEFLRKEFGEKNNTSRIIEIAYDLQAGSYINFAEVNPNTVTAYTQEIATLLGPHLEEGNTLLDVGAGELTTLSQMLNKLELDSLNVFAFDISWSRLHKGLEFWERTVVGKDLSITPFVADIKKIPLPSKSIDVVTSSHALEPNGVELSSLLEEIFRVTKGKCVLFEPSYENNTEEGKERMDRLGYIKGVEEVVESLGGKVVEVTMLDNPTNPLNPTACFVIIPANEQGDQTLEQISFSVPGTDFPLNKNDGFLASSDTGMVYPVLNGIPVLKENNAILATSLFD